MNQVIKDETTAKIVAEILGYKGIAHDIYSLSFTEDIYFKAFFYLTKRFGDSTSEQYDELKEAAGWLLDAGNGINVHIWLNSSWVNFRVYDKNKDDNFYPWIAPWGVHYNRLWKKHRTKLVDAFNEAMSEEESALAESYWEEFCKQYPYDEADNEAYWDKNGIKWIEFIEAKNNEVLCFDREAFTQKYGQEWRPARIRNAERVFRKFVKSLLEPIWVRDVSFNILGNM